ncbi:hypothetical protein [Streptomyces europaeiscabiei]|uniref:hypothetical protein n=1 Tax=Streptomyces europaeiscabiei TaxID=146819 RepID=UPI002E13E3F2|nr:hypothetical protein OHB30_00050 [Streptomyces europaeiscabiei]WSG28419.1 hypothetical protein OHB30_50280 [Streptomyces europaeiscabiei]
MLLIDELAAVLCPLPEPGSVIPEEAFPDAYEAAERERSEYASNLEAASLGIEADPLILALEEARAQREAADRRVRLVLAYAREFQPASRYPLRELGPASGYTPSGVTTAYDAQQIELVQSRIHRAPRRPVPGEDPS